MTIELNKQTFTKVSEDEIEMSENKELKKTFFKHELLAKKKELEGLIAGIDKLLEEF